MEWLSHIVDWASNNRQWVFSGIGVFALGLVLSLIRFASSQVWRRHSPSLEQHEVPGGDSVVIHNSHNIFVSQMLREDDVRRIADEVFRSNQAISGHSSSERPEERAGDLRERFLQDLIMAARAVECFVRFDALPQEALPGLPDLRFSADKSITHGADFLALSDFGQSIERGIAPQRVVLNPAQPDVALTYIHELGHYVDFYLVRPVGEFSSPVQDVFCDWRSAVWSTEAAERLWRARYHAEAVIRDDAGGSHTFPIDHQRARSLSSYHELWARSFTQYVVSESDSRRLHQLLDQYRTDPLNAVYGLYWTDDDFGPVANTVRGVLGMLYSH